MPWPVYSATLCGLERTGEPHLSVSGGLEMSE